MKIEKQKWDEKLNRFIIYMAVLKKKLEDRGKNLTCETDRKAVAEAGKNKMKTKR